MRRELALVLAVGLLLGARCAPLRTQGSAQDSTLRLPVRVHLLRSSESAALTTTRTAADVRTLLATANEIWAQSGIKWVLDSVVHAEAPYGAAFDSLLRGDLQPTRERLLAIVPRAVLREPGWNLFLIRDFGQIAGGVFYADIAGAILAERGMGIELTPGGRGGATLAHELGHSLGLEHRPCDETRNIMALGCWSATAPSTLTAEQVAQSRRQGATGRPVTREPWP